MTERDPNSGQFLPGNKFWTARSSHGRAPKFETADDLTDACEEYFNWAHDNPLMKDQLVTFQGSAKHEPVAMMRAMTMKGLCLFLDVSEETWRGWKTEGHDLHRPDLVQVIKWAEAVIWQQKFEGAAADLLNQNIIARDLGLAEKKELTGADGGPMEVKGLADFYADLATEPEPGAP